MYDWRSTALADLCQTVTSGGTPSRACADYFTPAEVPWVKTMDLSDGPVSGYDEWISQVGLANSAAKMLPAGTVLMAMYGATVGRMGYLTEPATCNQAACALVADPTKSDARWLYYALLHIRDGLIGLASGAAQQNLNTQIIRNATVNAPPLTEQRGIAEVLGALDDKIAANTTFITRCEALAHAKYTSAIRGGLARPLSELARFVNGKAFTKDASGAGRVVIRIAELNSGLGASTVYNDIDVADDHVARPGDLLFAWSGSLTVHRWFRPEGIVNQHIFKVIPDQGFPMWLVHQALLRKLAEFKGIAADKATTMGHIQRRHLDEDVLIPAPDVITSLDQAMRGLWDRALAAEVENEQLSSTRDELLPLLMSGKVSVKDAESVVGEVL